MATSPENTDSLFYTLYSCKNCGYLITETEVSHLRIDLECPECGCKLFRKKAIKNPKQV